MVKPFTMVVKRFGSGSPANRQPLQCCCTPPETGTPCLSGREGVDLVPDFVADVAVFSSITSIDWRYQLWKIGVTFTDNAFLYSLWYFIFSILGNYNYFFFAAHLLDVAVAVPSLKTILQSVTHNGKQVRCVWQTERVSYSDICEYDNR